MAFNPTHYLPLLEQKAGALDQAAPLAEWDLSDEFAALRRLMEAQMIKTGRREYVQVLRLLEIFKMRDLHVAIKNALRMGAIGFDAGKHLVLCQVDKRPPKLDLDVCPNLPKANVGTISAASYMALMRGAGSMTEAPQILLELRLNSLRLPTVLREYVKLVHQSATEGLDHVQFFARLIELEMPGGARRQSIPCAPLARPRAAHDRASDQGGEVPGRQKPR